MMMPGQKGRKSGAGLPAGGFLNLGPAKNMSKKPLFEEKIRGLGMFLELRSIQQFGIIWNGDQKNKSF